MSRVERVPPPIAVPVAVRGYTTPKGLTGLVFTGSSPCYPPALLWPQGEFSLRTSGGVSVRPSLAGPTNRDVSDTTRAVRNSRCNSLLTRSEEGYNAA
jgi:hypothetical protein